MNRIIVTLLCLVGSAIGLHCQTTYTFAYDNSGNRVKRLILESGNDELTEEEQQLLEAAGQAEENKKEAVIEEKMNGQTISIYPNPTAGKMAVQVSNMEADAEGTVEVFDMQGRKLLSQAVTSERGEIDLSAQPSGNYLLTVQLGSQSREWQIVKK